ncbi:MAG TPA: non-ribosomal peptide synthetase, partial [Thermoanaerobaculia bacterium]|nr:non-ribosomal peptide synthetase [Thermoanaerobaculia bacterium]
MITREASDAAVAARGRGAATTIHGLFALQAAQRPSIPALVHAGGESTYGELARCSARLARRLRRRGVGRGDLVAVAAERGPEAVVAMLAVLEAGAAYVPLDAGYPAERLAAMLADSRPALLLVQEGLAAALPSGLPVLALDATVLADAADAADGEGLAPVPVDGDDLAYVCFTSGSTGRPKGVAVPHRGVVRLVADPEYVHLGPEETVLQVAPLAFDAATFEVWGALANGARLVLPPPGRLSLAELARWVTASGVTTLHLTAGLFQQFVDAHPEALAGVRQLLTGGDVVSAPHVRRALARVGERVVACYGPTESTTFTSCHPMAAAGVGADAGVEAGEPSDTVPIGRPIRATRVVLLDAQGEPIEAAGEGELAIAGEGLARGYLGCPAATAERFVPDPTAAGDTVGGRLYRTGDLARRRADGVLEFLGRLDDQVKIRGFRVEPGEVEAVLADHPAVAGAAVVALPAAGGGKRLVAFASAAPATGAAGLPAGRELRAWLAGRLPEYMVPAAVVVLDELPLTANQKVDRRALAGRAPGAERPELPTPFAAPRTAAEARVAAIYAEMLGLDEVGADDDLFELGGHSLAATRIIARLREETGVELPMTLLFTH